MLTILRNTSFVGEVYPKTVGDYNAARAKHAGLFCPCDNTQIAFKSFATVDMTANPVCGWVKNDLANDKESSSCKLLDATHQSESACAATTRGCEDSVSLLTWAQTRFNESFITSGEVASPVKVASSANASWVDTFELSKIITLAPYKEIESWAASNMPKVLDTMSDITERVQGLSARSGHDIFIEHFKANCTRTGCAWTNIANGKCDKSCDKAACFYDGGDCAGMGLHGNLDSLRHMPYYTLEQPEDSDDNDYDLNGLGEPSWLSVPSSNFTYSGIITCNRTSWNRAVRIDPQDTFNDIFGPIAEELQPYTEDDWPGITQIKAVLKDMPTHLKFKSSRYLGCDEYARTLTENLFADEPDASKFEQYMVGWTDWTTRLLDAWGDVEDTVKRKYIANSDLMRNFYLPIQAGKNSKNLMELKQNLFMEDVRVSIDYEKYFAECDVKMCTYTYEANISVYTLASIVLGLIGGVTTVMGLLSRIMYNILKYTIIYRRGEDDVAASAEVTAAPGEAAGTDATTAVKETEAV